MRAVASLTVIIPQRPYFPLAEVYSLPIRSEVRLGQDDKSTPLMHVLGSSQMYPKISLSHEHESLSERFRQLGHQGYLEGQGTTQPYGTRPPCGTPAAYREQRHLAVTLMPWTQKI